MNIRSIFAPSGKGTLAIDIGSAAIKYIKFEGGRVTDYGVREIAEVFDIPSILKELTMDFEPGQVLSFVSGPAVSIRQAPFPKMGTRELKDAIFLRLDKYSPFTLDESILDFTVISDIREAGMVRDNVMVVAARRDVVSEHIATFKKAGLEPTAISVIPFALVSSARRFARLRADEVVCMVDIGSQFTNIVFIRNQKLDLTRTITIAGNAITEAMTVALATESGELALSVSEAEDYKKQYGIPSADSTEKLPSGIPVKYLLTLQEPILARLLAEINRSIDYYRREFTVPGINRILLCGGGATLKNLAEYVTSNVGVTAEVFDPFRTHNLYRRDRPFSEGLGARLVGVLGLIFDTAAVDLLPKELKSLRARKSDVKKVIVLSVLVIPILIAINFILALNSNAKKRSVVTFKQKLKALEVINADYYDLKSDIAELETRQKTLTNVIGLPSNMIPIMRQLSYFIPSNIQLKTFTLTKDKGIKMTGMVASQQFLLDLDLTQFMIQLEASSYFKNVKLVNKTRTTLSGDTVLDFELSVELE